MNLKELSHTLGLSQTTVSRALNGYPEVNAETRARVERAAREHNYRPNTRAKGLATGQAMTIGHVIPMATKHEMVNPIFADFIAGASFSYSKRGYEMLLTMVEDGTEEQAYRNLKSRGSVDGVVLHAPRMDDRRMALLESIGLPFAVHGRATGHDRPYCWLDVNNRSAFHRATDFLLDLGHRRIALINGIESMDFAHRRRRGYEDAMTARGLPIDPAIMRADEMTESLGYASVTEMQALDHPPTAYIVSSMICALGVRRAVESMGMKMGQDVSIVTHDDALSYLRNGDTVPIFTATRSSVRAAGEQLANMLLDKIAQPDAPEEHVLLEAELMVGSSTGPAPA